MVHWKPFKSKFSLYSSVTAECIFFVFTIMMYGFLTKKQEHLIGMGWTMISMVVGSLGTSWVCVVFQQIQAYYYRIHLKRIKEEHKKTEMTEDQLNQKEQNKVNNKPLDELDKELKEISTNNKNKFEFKKEAGKNNFDKKFKVKENTTREKRVKKKELI